MGWGLFGSSAEPVVAEGTFLSSFEEPQPILSYSSGLCFEGLGECVEDSLIRSIGNR